MVLILGQFTFAGDRKIHSAGRARLLKTPQPTTVPIPKSPSVTKVPKRFMKRSGDDTAAAIKVAPATSELR